MMRTFSLLGVFVVVLGSSLAFAQSAAPRLEDKKALKYNEIERGFFFEGRGGFFGVINPPALPGGRTYFSAGQAIGLDMGFDIGERVSPSIFLLASSNRMLSDYTGLNTTGAASGDFGAMIPGAAVKVRLVGLADSQEVQRTWIYLRAAGGVVFYSPPSLLPTLDVLISGGAGIEYFTRLRHFVIGVEANFNFMALTQSVGFSVLPTVKYAF
jgi:hypothetical protein